MRVVARSELIAIGRFADLSGLSVHALRHYDDVGLLVPADVDPATGYRRYQRSQLRDARVIKALRSMDLPIEEIKLALDPRDSRAVHQVLSTHRQRLERQHSALAARTADVEYYLEKGLTMSPVTGARPVQLKIRVDDIDEAIAFYQSAFGFHYDITRRTEDAEYSSFVFSRYGEADFFLLHLIADAEQADRPGATTFGLLVEDLAEAHKRALAAGAVELVEPHGAEGMPRNSAVRDPSGNWIWLYQD